MFIVSSSNLMAFGHGFGHDLAGLAGSSGLEIAQDAADELGEMQFQFQATKLEKMGGAGGLKRTVSSLHSCIPSVPAVKAGCSHTNQSNNCIVEAKQVEMDFATLTNQPFQLTIHAPNGEQSQNFQFLNYGETKRFTPVRSGCGHGHWVFELSTFSFDSNQEAVVKKTEEKIYLDGVGSLFFTIDDNMSIRLSSQEFLRLPSASQCCGNKKL